MSRDRRFQHTRSLIRAIASRLNINSMSVKLLTEHHLEFLCLKGGYTGSSESTLVKMPHCWKSRHGSYDECFCLLTNTCGDGELPGDRKWFYHI